MKNIRLTTREKALLFSCWVGFILSFAIYCHLSSSAAYVISVFVIAASYLLGKIARIIYYIYMASCVISLIAVYFMNDKVMSIEARIAAIIVAVFAALSLIVYSWIVHNNVV